MQKLTRIDFFIIISLISVHQAFGNDIHLGFREPNFNNSPLINFTQIHQSGAVWVSPQVGSRQVLVFNYEKQPKTANQEQYINEAQKMISSVYNKSYGISQEQAVSEVEALRGDNAQLVILKNLDDNTIEGTLILIAGQLHGRNIQLPVEKFLGNHFPDENESQYRFSNLPRGEESIYELSKFVLRSDLNFEAFKDFQKTLALFFHWFTKESSNKKRIIFYAKKKSLMRLYQRYFFSKVLSERIITGPDDTNYLIWLLEVNIINYLNNFIKAPKSTESPCIQELLSVG
jgi:hypothetical protein